MANIPEGEHFVQHHHAVTQARKDERREQALFGEIPQMFRDIVVMVNLQLPVKNPKTRHKKQQARQRSRDAKQRIFHGCLIVPVPFNKERLGRLHAD